MGDDAKDFLSMTIADLKTGADFEKANPPGAPPKPDGERVGGDATATPDAKVIFESATGASASDEVIDIPNRAEVDQLTRMLGGPGALPAASQSLREALALGGVDAGNYAELIEGMTVEEEHAAIVAEVNEWNSILASPAKARAALDALWSHPEQEPMASYILGRASDDAVEAITKLHQVAHGEKPVGRGKGRRKIDGRTY